MWFLLVVLLWPEEGTLANIIELTESVGGCALNNAVNHKVLDPSLTVGTMGLIGDDDRGQFIRRTLEGRGVEQAGVHAVEGSTSYSDVMTAKSSGRRTFFHDRGVCARWSYEHVPFDAIAGRYGYVQLGYQLLLDSMDESDPEYGTVMGRTLARFRDLGLRTSLDLVSEESDRYRMVALPSLPHVDDLIINEVEASRLTGISDRDPGGTISWANLSRMADGLFAAGVGPVGFSMLRTVLTGLYADNLVWSWFWEEGTELLFVAGVCFVLWIFRAGLFPRASRAAQERGTGMPGRERIGIPPVSLFGDGGTANADI